jgi:hypothetical protein
MTSRSRAIRAGSILTTSAVLAALALTVGGAPTATAAITDAPAVTLAWQKQLTTGRSVLLGGAGVGNLDGHGTDLVFGDRAGKVWAFTTAGATVAGWPYKADASIESTPAINGTGSGARVYIGVGTSDNPSKGGYLKLSGAGKGMWEARTYLLPGNRGGTRGVMGSLALGPIQSSMDVVGGAMGQEQLAINTGTGHALSGFPWLQADTNFSSPALADLYHTGHDYIIEGGDSSKGIAGATKYTNGGHIRVLRNTGHAGRPYQNSGIYCEYDTNQVVQSSPAVGNFLDGGATVGIVAGTGTYFKGASNTNQVIAITTACKLRWKTTLDGSSLPSPALADVDGDPSTSPDVVTESGAGTLYVLSGTTGSVRWKIPFGGGASGSPTTFKDPNGNFQDIVVPTGSGVYLVNGLSHQYTKISTLHAESPETVTADANGKIGITVLGYNGSGTGTVEHYTVNGSSNVSTVQTPGAWPMFHHDPLLTGYASDLPVTQ